MTSLKEKAISLNRVSNLVYLMTYSLKDFSPIVTLIRRFNIN